MTSPSDRTIGELGRLLDAVVTRLESVVNQIDQTYLRKDLFLTEKQNITERLEKIESRSEWLVRTVGALIIAAIFSAIFVAGKVH